MSAEFFSRRKLESARQFRLTANKAAVGGVSKLMRKPRVLFLAPHLDDSGFESRYVSHLLRRLKDSGERIFVLRPGAGLSGGIRYFLSLLRRVPRCDIVQLN
ncbi:MAG: hypothetical protein ACE5GA_09320, partial [Candidatus Zixiibacteriota bacterium]